VLVRLARHACAGSRDRWAGDDAERPLDPVGGAQALALAELLGRAPAGRLLSSPSRRCVDTLAPLAARWEVPVEREAALAADAPADALLDLVTARAFDGDLLCTHGEAMERLLARLGGVLVAGDPAELLAKGTLWELTIADGEVRALRHVVPSGFRRCVEHADGFVRT
jgi:phosphohistidine phosphatase SixA